MYKVKTTRKALQTQHLYSSYKNYQQAIAVTMCTLSFVWLHLRSSMCQFRTKTLCSLWRMLQSKVTLILLSPQHCMSCPSMLLDFVINTMHNYLECSVLVFFKNLSKNYGFRINFQLKLAIPVLLFKDSVEFSKTSKNLKIIAHKSHSNQFFVYFSFLLTENTSFMSCWHFTTAQ